MYRQINRVQDLTVHQQENIDQIEKVLKIKRFPSATKEQGKEKECTEDAAEWIRTGFEPLKTIFPTKR
jgi:hypothetical protein